ncbi:hypothetical protein IAD21_00494 [Abditibacteriota bacterium]|nr:hypothetical protein IAD21_00494 [Abditibacteriota bacterium]
MKRRVAGLALPLVLFALVWGAKWHVDHPTPTKEDLEMRAFFSTASRVKINYFTGNPKTLYESSQPIYSTNLPGKESAGLSDCFYLSPNQEPGHWAVGRNGTLLIRYSIKRKTSRGFRFVTISLDLEKCRGTVIDGSSDDPTAELKDVELHPITARRWVELFLANPRIGPELKARIKSHLP